MAAVADSDATGCELKLEGFVLGALSDATTRVQLGEDALRHRWEYGKSPPHSSRGGGGLI